MLIKEALSSFNTSDCTYFAQIRNCPLYLSNNYRPQKKKEKKKGVIAVVSFLVD